MYEAWEEYFSYMETKCGQQNHKNDQHLETEHAKAYERALQVFQSKRIRDSNFSEDPYKTHFQKVS